jgi:hypothetical protein
VVECQSVWRTHLASFLRVRKLTMAIHSNTMMALAEMASSMSFKPSPMRVDSSCGLLVSYLLMGWGRVVRRSESGRLWEGG